MPAESYTPDPALVDLVARAAYEADSKQILGDEQLTWDEQPEQCHGWFRVIARAVLAALATEPDLWQYGMPDLYEGPDAVMTFEGKPRIITPRMVCRPLRAVGPWLPAPTPDKITEETP